MPSREWDKQVAGAVVGEAITWLGVRFRHMGRDRATGIDCAGLVINVGRDLGLTDYDPRDYGRRPIPGDFISRMRGHLDDVPLGEIAHGDVPVFRSPRHPCHCGIVDRRADGLWLIHAFAPRRRVVEERLVDERLGAMVLAFRYRRPAGWQPSL